ncbi:hypothetical protein V8C42DRAFT_62637 [Trichoderma barbatum]
MDLLTPTANKETIFFQFRFGVPRSSISQILYHLPLSLSPSLARTRAHTCSVSLSDLSCLFSLFILPPTADKGSIRKHSTSISLLLTRRRSCPLFASQAVAAAPISIPSHRAMFHLCAQPIRVPSQGVPPSQRRAAAAIVAKSPFQQARPIFGTLMRKRAATTWVPLAPGATNYHRALPVYPASHRPQCEQLSACTRPIQYPIKRAHVACMAAPFACIIQAGRSNGGLCPRNRRNRKASHLETSVQHSGSGSLVYTAPANDGYTGSPVKGSPFGLASSTPPVYYYYQHSHQSSV